MHSCKLSCLDAQLLHPHLARSLHYPLGRLGAYIKINKWAKIDVALSFASLFHVFLKTTASLFAALETMVIFMVRGLKCVPL